VACATLETGGLLSAGDQAFCTVQDVSRTGIGLHTGQPPMCGQTVCVRIGLDDEVHELRGRVTRTDRIGKGSFHQVGLDWSGCSPEQITFLDRVLAVVDAAPPA